MEEKASRISSSSPSLKILLVMGFATCLSCLVIALHFESGLILTIGIFIYFLTLSINIFFFDGFVMEGRDLQKMKKTFRISGISVIIMGLSIPFLLEFEISLLLIAVGVISIGLSMILGSFRKSV